MGDRTAVQVYVLDCPPEQVRDLLEALEELGGFGELTDDWASELAERGVLRLGACYGSAEWSCGWAGNDLWLLDVAAPDAAYVAWEDPKYEWLGQVVIKVPGLGTFSAECDSSGNAQFSASQIMTALRQGEDLERIIGAPWWRWRDERSAELESRFLGGFVRAPRETGEERDERRERFDERRREAVAAMRAA